MAAKLRIRPTSRNAYGLPADINARAKARAVGLSYSLFSKTEKQTSIIIIPARTTEAVKPVTAMKSRITGMQIRLLRFPRPRAKARKETRKERCIPETELLP